MKVMVTGTAGPRGRLIATHLVTQGHEVVGVDTDPWPSPPDGMTFHQLDHRKRGFDELMRTGDFEAMVHLAVHAGFRLSPSARHRLNIEGSNKLLALAAERGIGKLVVASHAAVYGALPDNPCFMTEDAPPSVGRALPVMHDLVTADLLASSAMWKHPDMQIVVLRVVHSLGPTSRDVLAELLRQPVVPTVMGFDPMVQVIHELDLAAAFGCALFPEVRGVFNVTGPGELPLSVLIDEVGAKRRPIPEALLGAAIGRFGIPKVPRGAIEFIKHPCLIDGSRFREATGYEPQRSLVETARSMRG